MTQRNLPELKLGAADIAIKSLWPIVPLEVIIQVEHSCEGPGLTARHVARKLRCLLHKNVDYFIKIVCNEGFFLGTLRTNAWELNF